MPNLSQTLTAFGRKFILSSAEIRQTPPGAGGGLCAQIVFACIKTTPFHKYFRTLLHMDHMRLQALLNDTNPGTDTISFTNFILAPSEERISSREEDCVTPYFHCT